MDHWKFCCFLVSFLTIVFASTVVQIDIICRYVCIYIYICTYMDIYISFADFVVDVLIRLGFEGILFFIGHIWRLPASPV